MIIISFMYVNKILILFIRPSVLAAAMLLLSACEFGLIEPYKLTIEQGNAVTQEEFESLYTGMTQEEVMKAIGAPMLQDPFHADRWDYYYRLKPGKGRERNSHFTLYFRGEVLVKIDGEHYKEY
jgi:outer membrane protein assembly factor BamE